MKLNYFLITINYDNNKYKHFPSKIRSMSRTSSQTKNLVILYQKLFNTALKKLKKQNKNLSSSIHEINIRKCLSIDSFQKLLVQVPILRETMVEMFQSGTLLNRLVKWRGQHSNMAISIKYLNRLLNLIKHPQLQKRTWAEPSSKFLKETQLKKKESSNVFTEAETLASTACTPLVLDQVEESKDFQKLYGVWAQQYQLLQFNKYEQDSLLEFKFVEQRDKRWCLNCLEGQNEKREDEKESYEMIESFFFGR